MNQSNDPDENIINTGKNALRTAAKGISLIEESLDQRFVDAVRLLQETSGNIITTGVGKSGIIAKKTAATLASTGKFSYYLHPIEAAHGDMGLVQSNDTIIVFSHSGETEELIAFLKNVSTVCPDSKIVTITSNDKSRLARDSDAIVLTHVTEESTNKNFAKIPTTSTTTTLAVADSLVLALHDLDGFKEDVFLDRHPGGAIGKSKTSTNAPNKIEPKAFIFDMDGVLIDSEGAWTHYQHDFSNKMFGAELYAKIGSTVGLSIDTIYKNAVKHGFDMPKEEYYSLYDKQAKLIYRRASATPDIANLFKYLVENKYKIGLVSSSRKVWIDLALNKLNLSSAFAYILSLNDNPQLGPKPGPDGYIKAMQELGVRPEQSIVLEDSPAGIRSGKDSGAFTIAYTEHVHDPQDIGQADASASNVEEVVNIIDNLNL